MYVCMGYTQMCLWLHGRNSLIINVIWWHESAAYRNQLESCVQHRGMERTMHTLREREREKEIYLKRHLTDIIQVTGGCR